MSPALVPLAHVAEWLRFYEKFWNKRLDALEALLKAEDRAAKMARKKKR